MSLDTENTSTPFLTNLSVGAVQWQNNSYSVVQWQNNSSAVVNWSTGSYLLYYSDGLGGYGKYVGFSGSIAAGSVLEVNAMMMDYELRKRW